MIIFITERIWEGLEYFCFRFQDERQFILTIEIQSNLCKITAEVFQFYLRTTERLSNNRVPLYL